MPLGVRRSHMLAAIMACGTAPVASTTQRRAHFVQLRRRACRRAPTTCRAVEQRRLEAHRRVACARRRDCARAHRMSSSTLRGSTATEPGTSTRPPRGPMQATCCAGCACGHHLVVARPGGAARHARRGSGRRRRPCRAGSRAGRPARRRARRAPASAPRRCRPGRRRRRARRSVRAGDRGRGSSAGSATLVGARRGRPLAGAMRQAATTAQAVIAPTSAKVSWKATSGVAGMRRAAAIRGRCRPGRCRPRRRAGAGS